MRKKYFALLSLLLCALLVLASLWGIKRFRGRFEDDLLKKAQGGDASAEFEVAKLYQNGQKNFPKDFKAAFNWYSRAATQGNAKAQNNLGLMFAKGEGTAQDDVAAFQWFQKAALQGDTVAERNLAVKYLNGLGAPQNYLESVKWFRKAAEQGEAGAQLGLSFMYLRGKGVQRDPIMAYAWSLVAQASGDDKNKNLSKKIMDDLQKQLSSAQVLDAQQLASSWWTSHGNGMTMPEYSHDLQQSSPKKQALVPPIMTGTATTDAKPVKIKGPDNRIYTFIPGTTKEQAIGYFSSKGITGNTPVTAVTQGSGETVLPSRSQFQHRDCETGHWVQSVSDDGSIVKLEDGSVWRVSDVDTVDTAVWLPTEDVITCDGKLVNTDSGDSVQASRLR